MLRNLIHFATGKPVINTCILLLISICSYTQNPNPIVTENALTGNPSTEWDITGAGDLTIQGFATDLSVDNGYTVDFKINVTDGASFNVKIYRLGYYNGDGARLVQDLGNFTGIIQPTPLTEPSTGLVDCGNWSVSASWPVPSNATPGLYIAKLTRTGNGGASHIAFVVRDDASTAPLLFQTSDATWQAYNVYGGNSLYVGSTSYPSGHAAKVSYNRPFLTRNGGGGSSSSEDWLFHAEYPMIRWLERNGYNLNYATNIDAARNPNLMNNHQVFLSVAHDEYWSKEQRDNITAARNNGKHLAFFSGNEIYWKTRWENSIDGSNTPWRTLVCYKEGTLGENSCGNKCDPNPAWTGLWRDGCNPPYATNDACLPENSLTGQISWVDNTSAIQVPFAYKNLRIWRNTSITTLTPGTTATLGVSTLGYEWNAETPAFANHYPNGRILMSETNAAGKTHKLSLYKHSSGAWVFGAGTVQWSWGLDAVHDGSASVEDQRMQQATVNLFADMNVQPGTLQSGLTPATITTDVTAPSTTINSPAHGATINAGVSVTVNGTATDNNTVAGVEISIDGGITWRPATGATSWTFTFTPSNTGTITILSRGFDDSGNMEAAGTAPSNNAKSVTVQTLPNPNNGPGGPILVIHQSGNPFSRYTVEILRAEGLNEFAVADISTITPPVLNQYDVIVLGEMSLNNGDVNMFTNWVNSGGVLIAFKPDALMANLFGITPAGTTLSNQYLLVNNAIGTPGAGIVNQTIQFHGTADLYTLNGASAIATLYSNATTATAHPAVTIKNVGSNGGKAIAFTYDLNKSIIYTRQGNPAWAGDERDGQSGPIRSNDLFFGAKTGDVQPDWIDLNKVQIPQADEQQRLLANIITIGNLHKKPLPRFWYLPRDLKAAVVMTGDDHANGGTVARFNQYLSLSSSNTQTAVDNWTAIRGSSYIYPNTPITNAQAAAFEAQGFEIGLHVNTGCANYTSASLLNDFTTQLPQLSVAFPGISAPSTNRTHCIAWSDWATKPKIELQKGIRLNTDYYYWPASWVLDRPGMFTGSGIPMRFADLDGSIIDNYQVATQLTDESGQTIATHISTLLDNAIGSNGYYGVFCANMHTDANNSPGSDDIINVAVARNIPVISAKQMLNWLDGRNNSSFESIAWNGTQLSFTITNNAGQHNLKAMLPVQGLNNSVLSSITHNGNPVNKTVQTIKGIDYAFFDAISGNYIANYITCVSPTAVITSNSPVCYGQSVNLTLQSATGQSPYDLVVNGVTYNDINPGQTFATFNTSGISIWGNSGSPTSPSVTDNQPIEIGTKFRSTTSGYITGIRFYKGVTNTGTHIGSLWTSTGTQLATATFTSETASGWQEVRFSTPVAIQPNTTYVASYFSQGGYFAISPGFFSSSGVTNGPITALQAGVDGPNGVYKYGGGFPDGGNTANYWVDVLFSELLPTATSLSYVLTSVTDDNNCNTSAPNISTASVTINPLPGGVLSAQSPFCAGQNLNLVFNSTTGTGPFNLVINGNNYNNVNNNTVFNSNIQAPASTPVSIWDNSVIGGEPPVSDNDAVELGVKFRSSMSGTISGVRFYKRVQQPNNATYTGRLWKADGTLLATCTFTNITNSGWQQANFSSPVTINANTTYIVSYHTPNGQYAFTANAFAGSAVSNGPLTALQSGTDGLNGVYKYGAGGIFPNDSYNNANYWVDVVFNGAGLTQFNLTSITDANLCISSGNLQTLNVTSSMCSPLPVTMTSLTAAAAAKKVILNWSTLTEIDNRGFEIYRSYDATTWQYIGFVQGAGNSSNRVNYNYDDNNLDPGRYYYRLKQIDLNGASKFSNIAVATLYAKGQYFLGQNYPNPFTNTTMIEFALPSRQMASLILMDLHGRVIKTLLSEIRSAGSHTISFSNYGLSSGIYFYKLEAGGFSDTRKMIIQ